MPTSSPELPESASAVARAHWEAVRATLDRTLICLDFDGTLAPIVDDPDSAHIHPGAPDALGSLTPPAIAVAVVTGRPCHQVLELGGLEALADVVTPAGGRLEIRGQYGNERWSSIDRRVVSPEPPPGLVRFRRALPELLAGVDLDEAHVEDKGLAVAVHTRRMREPDAAAQTAREALEPVARELGLGVEPGRFVVEVRAAGMDKGEAIHQLVEELSPAAVVFIGDDLGDIAGFQAVERFRREGGLGLLVCSGSTEEQTLEAHADLVVSGPDGVVALLTALRQSWDG